MFAIDRSQTAKRNSMLIWCSEISKNRQMCWTDLGGELLSVTLNVDAAVRTLLFGAQPLIHAVHVKQMHTRKTPRSGGGMFTTYVRYGMDKMTYLTSHSISNFDKHIGHFSQSSSSSTLLTVVVVVVEELQDGSSARGFDPANTRRYLCGKVFRSIVSWVAPCSSAATAAATSAYVVRASIMIRCRWCRLRISRLSMRCEDGVAG